MKRRIFSIVIVIALTFGAVMAQPKAIGARLGYNFELSYQHQTENGMVEIDAGYSPFITQKGVFIDEDGDLNVRKYRYECIQAVIFYDWLMNIVSDFNWYVGIGAGVTWGIGDFFDSPHYDRKGNLVTYRRLGLPIGGQIGMEYNFQFPLTLSLDWRPMVNVFGINQGDYYSHLLSFALGLRYQF